MAVRCSMLISSFSSIKTLFIVIFYANLRRDTYRERFLKGLDGTWFSLLSKSVNKHPLGAN